MSRPSIPFLSAAVMSASLWLGALLITAGPSIAQRTWVVDHLNRPGADFVSLQAAVDAAADGDILKLRYIDVPSTLSTYLAPVIDGKGLVIRGETLLGAEVVGPWRIRNVGTRQQVILEDLRLGTRDSSSAQPLPTYFRGLECANNLGAIHLRRIEFGFYWQGLGQLTRLAQGRPIQCTDCSLITVTDSTIHLVVGWHLLLRSHMVVTNSHFAGGLYPEYGIFYSPTISIEHGTLTLVDSIVDGTDGGPRGIWWGVAAAEICYGTIRLAGTSALRSGYDWGAGFRTNRAVDLRGNQLFGCGFHAPFGSQAVVIDPRSRLETPAVVNNMVYLTEPVAGLRANLGTPSPFDAVAYTAPNSLIVVATSFLEPIPVLRLNDLPLHLDPTSLNILAVGIADQSGQFQLQRPISPIPIPGATVGVQAVELRPDGTFQLSNVIAPFWYQ